MRAGDMIAALDLWKAEQAARAKVHTHASVDVIGRLSAWQRERAPWHEARRTDFTYHPDCTQCCQLGRCHWCLVHGGSGRITYDVSGRVISGGGATLISAAAPDGFTYWMCAGHIRFFRETSRGRSFDPLAGTGFDPNSPSDRHNQAQGMSPLLYIPTTKDIDRQNS
jgi:hypothetical protein